MWKLKLIRKLFDDSDWVEVECHRLGYRYGISFVWGQRIKSKRKIIVVEQGVVIIRLIHHPPPKIPWNSMTQHDLPWARRDDSRPDGATAWRVVVLVLACFGQFQPGSTRVFTSGIGVRSWRRRSPFRHGGRRRRHDRRRRHHRRWRRRMLQIDRWRTVRRKLIAKNPQGSVAENRLAAVSLGTPASGATRRSNQVVATGRRYERREYASLTTSAAVPLLFVVFVVVHIAENVQRRYQRREFLIGRRLEERIGRDRVAVEPVCPARGRGSPGRTRLEGGRHRSPQDPHRWNLLGGEENVQGVWADVRKFSVSVVVGRTSRTQSKRVGGFRRGQLAARTSGHARFPFIAAGTTPAQRKCQRQFCYFWTDGAAPVGRQQRIRLGGLAAREQRKRHCFY